MSTSGDENISLLGNIASLRLRQYKPRYRLRWLSNKAVILVVIWSYLVNSVFHAFHYATVSYSKSLSNHNEMPPTPTAIILISLTLLFPVGGWLADSYLGRHKTIRYSTWIMWISVILITLWEILNKYVISEYLSKLAEIKVPILVILYVLLGIGLVGFQANIIQLGIDQLRDASSMEITSFISTYAFTLFTSGIAFQFINGCYSSSEVTSGWNNLLMMLYVAVSLTLAICIDFIFGSCLVIESVPVTTNSITLIAKVLKYVIMNRNRRIGDTFDIAKQSFGGPFENQHVENVKTFLRMLFVVSIGSVVASQIIVFAYAQGELQLRFRDWNSYNCYVQTSIKYSSYICGAVVILLYEIVIYPLLNRCIPRLSTLNIFLIGILFSLLRVLSILGVEVGAYTEHTEYVNVSTLSMGFMSCRHDNNVEIEFSSVWMIAIGSLEGIYTLLFIMSGYLFSWAQAPSSMKGLIIGMMFGFLGLNAMLQSAISAPFLFADLPWHRIPLSCGIWYFMMQAVIISIVFVVFYFIVKRYTQRQERYSRLNAVFHAI